MAKAELKTKKTEASVEDFLNAIKDADRRNDCFTVLEMMEKATGAKAKMWGGSVVGFGNIQLKYASGRELDWFVCGFSPRKADLTLYGTAPLNHADLLKKLGKHKTGKGCLYINSLQEVDLKILNQLVKLSVNEKKKK